MIKFPKALTDADAPIRAEWIGRGVGRVDGPAKVQGEARYAAEFKADDLAYGVIVSSAISKGRIASIDTAPAKALPGVLEVFTHENRPGLAWFDRSWKDEDSVGGSPFRPLDDAKILFGQQPIALVVAESFELARHAAQRVEVRYDAEAPSTDLRAAEGEARDPKKGKTGWEPPPSRGDADAALQAAPVKVSAEYRIAVEHHNPMEIFATTVARSEDGFLTVYDKTQGVANTQSYIEGVFGLDKDEFKVCSPFVGGAFGSALRPQYQLFLAVLAARELKRSVQVSMTRQQMFSFGHRPETIQRLALGAERDGTLTAIVHETISETSTFEDYAEAVVNWSAMLYRCPDVRTDYQVVSLDNYTPLDMRAPGAASGVYALESAIDELAHELKIDPLELRLKNYAERDQTKDKPFSSKALRECYSEGAARFGWERRNHEPRSMREGDQLIGWGMATGVWDSMQMKASAKAVLSSDGTATVCSGTADIGCGTYTIMTQIAAEVLGLRLEDVRFELGDSSQPEAPLEGGSWTAASVGTAVKGACDRIADRLVALANKLDDSPLGDAKRDEIVLADGCLKLIADPSRSISISEVMRRSGEATIDESATTLPNLIKQMGYARNVHSAVFVEVAVDDAFGTVRVRRVVSAVAGGRILNEKTAKSQIMGAVVMGMGMALEEESVSDTRLGRFMNHNLAEYHVPVHADVPTSIDVIFVEEHDEIVNPLGVKGLGEIGIVGVAAAVANAIHHATGRRVRDLPITLDKVMAH